jgi:hypothetical protein
MEEVICLRGNSVLDLLRVYLTATFASRYRLLDAALTERGLGSTIAMDLHRMFKPVTPKNSNICAD